MGSIRGSKFRMRCGIVVPGFDRLGLNPGKVQWTLVAQVI